MFNKCRSFLLYVNKKIVDLNIFNKININVPFSCKCLKTYVS